MTARRPAVRAFLLIEVLAVAAIGLILGDLLVRVVIDLQRLQHGAVLHADRMAVADALAATLRRDALSASSHDYGPKVAPSAEPPVHELSLKTWTDGRPHRVVYHIALDRVTRTQDGVETHVWQARRLEFTPRLERGPRGDVLWLDFAEQSDDSIRRLPRKFSCPLLLPTLSEGAP